MPVVAVVDAVRTPAGGTSAGRRNGGLAGIHPADLPAGVRPTLVERTGTGTGTGPGARTGIER